MARTKLFYFMWYDSSQAWIKTRIGCVGRNQENVREALERLKKTYYRNSYASFSGVLPIETDAQPIGDDVWIVFISCGHIPEMSEIKYVGNSKEDCLNWWRTNFKDYCCGATGGIPQFVATDESGVDFICNDERVYFDPVHIMLERLV